MSKVMQTTVIEIEGMLEELRNKHSSWEMHQRQSDSMLYALLDGSLDFYRLLKTDEECFAAFKELLDFKWNRKTKLSTMIVKAIFGEKAKKGYAYAKALEAAYAADIGKSGTTSMTHWLNDNGGISGVVRVRNAKNKANAEREHAIDVGRNVEAYGVKRRGGAFTSSFITDNYKGIDEFVLLCKYDAATKLVHIMYESEDKTLVDDLYAEAGELVMKHLAYRNNRLKVKKAQTAKKDAAASKVKASLSNIVAKATKAETMAKAA